MRATRVRAVCPYCAYHPPGGVHEADEQLRLEALLLEGQLVAQCLQQQRWVEVQVLPAPGGTQQRVGHEMQMGRDGRR